MTNDTSILNEHDRTRLILIAAVFTIFLSGYAAYSVGKFKMLQTRSLVGNNVVMKVIQHNVRCVCPTCGTKGIPLCPSCGVPMFWNGYRGIFVCPACGNGGFPRCPRCQKNMSWIETQ